MYDKHHIYIYICIYVYISRFEINILHIHLKVGIAWSNAVEFMHHCMWYPLWLRYASRMVAGNKSPTSADKASPAVPGTKGKVADEEGDEVLPGEYSAADD